jgi:putative oxygen-independent coproporphyrinogen III oxidase
LSPLDVAQRHLRPGTLTLTELPPLALYIHLPWCIRKCPYCDFNSHEWRGDGQPPTSLPGKPVVPVVPVTSQPPEQAYLQALLADLDAALPLVWGRPVVSVFVGGGTPSLFSPHTIDALLAGVRARLKLLPGAEVTLEANPGTFERERFAAFRGAGVTRLSVGVQSFSDEHLQVLGRVHQADQAKAAVEDAARAFDTFNIDLMYALPGQSLEQLHADLDTALSLHPPHLSVYHLTIEPNTFFAKHPPALPDEDTAYAMLDAITERTAAQGLRRYEVSAYAREGHACAHNQNYWQFGDYLGIGAGAHSKLSFAHRVVRQVRVRDPRAYMARAHQPEGVVVQDEEVARADLPFEYMLGALRLREGFALAEFSARTGLPPSAIEAGLARAESQGLITRDLHRVQPTERGFDFLSDLQGMFLPG